MKIGFDAKRAIQNFTGLGVYSRFVINNLAKDYPDNTYVLFSPKAPSKENESLLFTLDNIKYFFNLKGTPFWRTFGIVKDIRKQNLSIYHGLSNELPYNIHKAGVKTIVTIHDLIFLRYPQFYPFIDRKIYNQKAKYACKIADKIVTVSERSKMDVVELYGVDPSKIEVIYPCSCSPIFSVEAAENQKKALKEKYNITYPYLLSVGTIEDRKNILLIVKALKYLPDNIHFIAIGRQRKYAKKVMQYVEENNLQSRVHFLSGISSEELPIFMQSCQIFIYPSLYEGFGTPIVEGIRSKVPVIAAKGSCLEETGGPNTIYVDPTNEKELATQIERIVNDPLLQKEMVDEGVKYVNSTFSDEKVTQQMMELYTSMLK